jgi:hypothetical protein
MASDGKTPIADGLRKCLLSFQLKSEKLKEWVEKFIPAIAISAIARRP